MVFPRGWNSWFSKASKFEFQEGSRYSTGDGNAGEFKKTKPGKAIKFTWENPRHAAGGTVEVTFQRKGDDRCGVIIAHDCIQTRADADDLRDAWARALDNLKSTLESKK